MRTHNSFLEEIKDFLEDNGEGHLVKALKEVFYKYIERILDQAVRFWPPMRGRQDVDTIQGHKDGDVRSPGRGHWNRVDQLQISRFRKTEGSKTLSFRKRDPSCTTTLRCFKCLTKDC